MDASEKVLAAGSLEPNGAFWSTVSVPPRWLAAEACTPTHRRPPETARPRGRLPTAIVRAAAFVVGSIRVTLPPNSLATQTPPAPTAIALGPLPTGTAAATALVCGSIRETVPSSVLATHAEP